MAFGESVRKLVGASREQEVSGKTAQFRPVGVALIIHRQGFVAGRGVQTPTDMADGVCVAIIPGSQISAHQFSVGAVPVDVGDVVFLDGQPDGALEIALEGQIDVTGIKHQRSVDRACLGKAHHNASWPVGDGSRPVRPAPNAGGRRIGHIYRKIRAGSGTHVHGRCTSAQRYR